MLLDTVLQFYISGYRHVICIILGFKIRGYRI